MNENHGVTENTEKSVLIEAELTGRVIGALIEVHRYWGAGLLEEIYERSVRRELSIRGIPFISQLKLPLIYKDENVGEDLRLDLLIENKLVVEIKAVKELLPVHEAQLLSYMKLTACKIGLLVNFYVPVLKNGIKRLVL